MVYTYIADIVPFSNPTGALIFVEDSVQSINLTLINNDTLEVCTLYMPTYVYKYCMYIHKSFQHINAYVCVYMCTYISCTYIYCIA